MKVLPKVFLHRQTQQTISREEVGSVDFVFFPESEMRCGPHFLSYSLAELVFYLVFSLSKKVKNFCHS